MLDFTKKTNQSDIEKKNILKETPVRPVQVIAVTGGKGGVGKTNISVNLSIALAKLNKKILLFDADLSLANIDILLNINVNRTLNHVVNHLASLKDIIIDGPEGIKMIPAGSGSKQLANLTPAECAGLMNAFDEIESDFDHLIIDTAAGISDDVIMFSKAANEIIIVVCDEPTSITDAYALIKILYKDHKKNNFHIITNMVENFMDGHSLFNKLNRATEQFLELSLNLCGIIPYDDRVKKSVQKQCAVVEAYPDSLATKAIHRIAKEISQWPIRDYDISDMRFFWHQLLNYKEKYEGL